MHLFTALLHERYKEKEVVQVVIQDKFVLNEIYTVITVLGGLERNTVVIFHGYNSRFN